MQKNILQATLLKAIFLLSCILLCTACGAEEEQEANLNKLFSVHSEDGAECMVSLEDGRIESNPSGGNGNPVLILEGKIPTGCGNLMMRVMPPKPTKEIEVYLQAISSSTEKPSEDPHRFYISMPLENLVEGTYTIIINEEVRLNFKYLEP